MFNDLIKKIKKKFVHGYCHIYNGDDKYMYKHPELYRKCSDFKAWRIDGKDDIKGDCKYLVAYRGGWCEIKTKRLNNK